MGIISPPFYYIQFKYYNPNDKEFQFDLIYIGIAKTKVDMYFYKTKPDNIKLINQELVYDFETLRAFKRHPIKLRIRNKLEIDKLIKVYFKIESNMILFNSHIIGTKIRV